MIGRHTDEYGDTFGFEIMRNPGDYVGEHRLSYAWKFNQCGEHTFKTNLLIGRAARHG